MRMSSICMSCDVPARARAPLLMSSFSPTCHISLTCIMITLYSHLASMFSFSFSFSFSKRLLSVTPLLPFLFHLMGCWGVNNLKEHSAKFSRSKRSSTGDGPSPASPPTTLSVLFNIQEAADCAGLFCGFVIGLEQIRDWIETIRLIFSWVPPRIRVQSF